MKSFEDQTSRVNVAKKISHALVHPSISIGLWELWAEYHIEDKLFSQYFFTLLLWIQSHLTYHKFNLASKNILADILSNSIFEPGQFSLLLSYMTSVKTWDTTFQIENFIQFFMLCLLEYCMENFSNLLKKIFRRHLPDYFWWVAGG
jgi:hypothetical protein